MKNKSTYRAQKGCEIFIILVLFLSVSCQKKKVDLYIENDKLLLNFPDTIFSNVVYDGVIDYNYPTHNAYRNTIGTGKISRYIHLYLSIDSVRHEQIDKIIATDTFLTQDINNIEFNMYSKRAGELYLNGYIVDIVIFDTISGGDRNEDLPAKISEIVVNKRIVVKNKSQ